MQAALLSRVQSAFQRGFDLDPRSITLDTQPDEIAKWDSLGHATLVCSLEREFTIRFGIDELMALENLRQIIAVVHRKLGAAG